MKNHLDAWAVRISWLLAILGFVYVVLRAIYVPFFSDEATTFFFYVQPGSFDPFFAASSANNHVLNSALMRMCYLAFGDAPLVLRLPNVLAYLLFVRYVFAFRDEMKNAWIGLALVAVLLASQYFSSFFHLARGYGLSMAFLLGSLYNLYVFAGQAERRHLVMVLVLGNLALLANLGLLVPVLCVFGWVLLIWIRENRPTITSKKTVFDLLLALCLGVLPLLYSIKIALSLKKAGALYHGTDEGFLMVVVKRFMTEFVPGNWNADTFYFWPFFALYMGALVWLAFRRKLNQPNRVLQLVLWLTVFGTIAIHILLGVKYPLDRAALHFFPLFVLSFFLVWKEMPKKPATILCALPALLLVGQQLRLANLTHTMHWGDEHVPHALMHHLRKWKDSTGILPLISCHELPGRGMEYSELQMGGNLNSHNYKDFPAPSADFVLTRVGYEEYPSNFVEVGAYPTGTRLLERKSHKDWMTFDKLEFERKGPTREGFVMGRIPLNPEKMKAVAAEISFFMQCKEVPCGAWLGMQLYDSSGKELGFSYIDLSAVKPDLRKGNEIRRRVFQDNIPPSAREWVISLMNVRGNEYVLRNGTLEVSYIPGPN